MNIQIIVKYRTPEGVYKTISRPTTTQGSLDESGDMNWALGELPPGAIVISLNFATMPLEPEDVVLCRAAMNRRDGDTGYR